MPAKKKTLHELVVGSVIPPLLGGIAWYFKINWLMWVAGFLGFGTVFVLLGEEKNLRHRFLVIVYSVITLAVLAGAYTLFDDTRNWLCVGLVASASILNIHSYILSHLRHRKWQKIKKPDRDVEELLAEARESYRFDLSALNTRRGLLSFVQSDLPVTEPVTKFGGQPVWIDKPQWPVSRELGKPMHFIGQIALDTELFGNKQAKMAYIFYSGYDETCGSTAEFDSGENAIILQPGGEINVELSDQAAGPALEFNNEMKDRRCEFTVELEVGDDPDFVRDYELGELSREQGEEYEKTCRRNKIGGTPYFYQFDDFPDEEPWQLLCQLEDDMVPFYVNFGVGMAYMFINRDGTRAKMMWQC